MLVNIVKLKQSPTTPVVCVEFYVSFDAFFPDGVKDDPLLKMLEERWIKQMEQIKKDDERVY